MKRNKRHKLKRWQCPLCKTNVREFPRNFSTFAKHAKVTNSTYSMAATVAEHSWTHHKFDISVVEVLRFTSYDQMILDCAMEEEFNP